MHGINGYAAIYIYVLETEFKKPSNIPKAICDFCQKRETVNVSLFSHPMKVLIIDDHPRIRGNVSLYLKSHDILADEAWNGEEALLKMSEFSYDVLVLDLNMPVMDGREFLKKIRNDGNDIPVLVLTSDHLTEDKVGLFELGADDYVVKPFELEELLARVQALYRRRLKPVVRTVKVGDIEIDPIHFKVRYQGEPIDLGAKEFQILLFLSENRGIPKNKTEILSRVWGESEERLNLDSVTLEAHISSLRKKLGKDCIVTLRNIGYVIE